ncbi:ATP-binding cassette domain-containing protein [Microbacterium sp. NPDC077663]|uniref:ATP-binding cassette domain-containing protein n=1 Tax=Microbacterium sp. NPDC077663 TaxID=3364189 RepID=UPI0037C660B5
MTTPRLAFDDVTVDFGVTRALDSVHLAFAPGEIVGLLGHNGAGKSTLVNVATGAVRATGGRMLIDGEHVTADTPRQAAELGITVIHQTPALVGNLTVLDNLYLGRGRTGRSKADRDAARAALAEVGGDDLTLDTMVSTLELGQRQVVDLARGLLHGAMKVLLLDEPTAALGQAETDALHGLIRRLAASGTTVIYVSHRLPDIIEVCDRVAILREGKVAGEHPITGLTADALATALVPDLQTADHVPAVVGERVLEITSPHHMTFHAGEVVGLFGVAAGEQFELLNALHGAGGVTAVLDGSDYRARTPLEAIRQGVHLVVADRDRDGLIAGLSARDNVYLPWQGRRANGRKVAPTHRARSAGYADARQQLGIVGPGADSPIAAFSGGNRQKHLLAAWLYPATPKVLLLAQPTQGVDVGAKADIRRAVRQAAAGGATVLVASAESDEIAGLCDRSYVLSGGSMAELPRTPEFDSALLQTLLDLIPTKGAFA